MIQKNCSQLSYLWWKPNPDSKTFGFIKTDPTTSLVIFYLQSFPEKILKIVLTFSVSAMQCMSSSWKTKRETIISQNVSLFFLRYSIFPCVSYLKKSSRQINTKGENVQALELGKTHSILLVRVNDVSKKTGLSQVDMRLRLAWWYVDLCPVLCETRHSPVERESTELIQ